MIGKFYLGATLYPFPVFVPGAFDGWSNREWRAYVAGMFLTLGLFVGFLVAMWARFAGIT